MLLQQASRVPGVPSFKHHSMTFPAMSYVPNGPSPDPTALGPLLPTLSSPQYGFK